MRRSDTRHWGWGGLAVRAGLLAVALVAAGPARAERAWVKDEVRLNVRTGPGTEYRIVGTIVTGDAVDIVSRAEGWTQVRPEGGDTGWIPEGFLQDEPPARVVLAGRKDETAELRERVAELEKAEGELRAENEEIAGRDTEQREQITELTRENLELKAGARWPEWITGGCIVLVGMALGAILQRSGGRSRKPKIRI